MKFIINIFILWAGWLSTDYIINYHQKDVICLRKFFCDKFEKSQNLPSSYYRSFEFKPRKIDDDVTRRFALMTSSHRYEMLTGEPRIGLNGVWRQEVEKVKSFGEKLVKEKNGAGDFEMIDLFRHDDAFAGIHYVITFQNKNENQISVELKRSFVEKPELKKVGIEANKEKVVNVIMPLSKVSDRFLMFLDRLQNSILSDVNANIRLIFIVFQQSRDDDVIDIIQKFQKKNPNSKILTKILQQKFNRAVGLATGSQLCSSSEILFFLDVDLTVSMETIRRIRGNVIEGERVFFPIVFSQYDPKIIQSSSALYRPLTEVAEIDKMSGFWLHYGFGIVAIYKSDFDQVGGFNLNIEGWGGEDVDFYQRVIASGLDVMSAVEPSLIHVYHNRGCDVTLSHDQYKMCVGAWAETLGSHLEVGLLLNERIKLP